MSLRRRRGLATRAAPASNLIGDSHDASFNTLGRGRTEFRSDRPLTDEQIHRYAPSIFAAQPHPSRAERYGHISTSRVLAALRREGFEAYQCGQSRVRDAGRADYTRHQLRLRHTSQVLKAVNDEVFEIVLLNSHDGSSAYRMYAGALRLVCSNGLVVGPDVADLRVPHKGDVTGRVIEGAFRVLDETVGTMQRIEAMKAEGLSGDEQRAFARAALALRWTRNRRRPVCEYIVVRPPLMDRSDSSTSRRIVRSG